LLEIPASKAFSVDDKLLFKDKISVKLKLYDSPDGNIVAKLGKGLWTTDGWEG